MTTDSDAPQLWELRDAAKTFSTYGNKRMYEVCSHFADRIESLQRTNEELERNRLEASAITPEMRERIEAQVDWLDNYPRKGVTAPEPWDTLLRDLLSMGDRG